MDIQRSFAVFTMATILTFLGMLIISATENGKLTFFTSIF
ncbi:KtrB [Staphylococcus aureus]|nr:KtrB [Staphylococcus aureus]